MTTNTEEDFIEEEQRDDSVSETDQSRALPSVDICSSEVLSQAELNLLLRRLSPQIVALVGEQDAGKTTLLASLYGQFCRGGIGDFLYAGSKTLVGFARRYHLALLSSGLEETKTPRTSRSDPAAYFHLAIKRSGESIRNLVISDRSGEVFEASRTDTNLIPELVEFEEAHRVVFLLDSDKLTALESRATYSRQFRQMIRALHDNGALSRARAIEVVATKIDYLAAQPNFEELQNNLSDFEKGIIDDFAVRGLVIECHRVCALPKAKPDFGFVGLAELLERWTFSRQPEISDLKKLQFPRRELDRLVGRWDQPT